MSGNFKLRPLTLADSARLWALDQRCFPSGIAYTQAEIRALLRQSERGFHIAIEGSADSDDLAGFILTLRNRDRGHVITVDVSPERRHQGIGQALMQAAEQHYGGQGTVGMRLEVAVNNLPALRFYAHLGYRVVRTLKAYYAADLDGLLLHKDWGGART